MDLKALTASDVNRLPLCGLAVVALRAAIRVNSLQGDWNTNRNTLSASSISLCEAVLKGEVPPDRIFQLSDDLYAIAASAAACFRVNGSSESQIASIAGVIMHSAVDCLADLGDDPTASLTNGILALRYCGKLNSQSLERGVIEDLERLASKVHSEVDRAEILIWFDDNPAN